MKTSPAFCLTLLLLGCRAPQVPAQGGKQVTNLGDEVYRKQFEAIYGASYANSLQPPGPVTDTVSNELNLAGTPILSESRRKTVRERVDAGVAGDKDKYTKMAGDHNRELQDLRDQLVKAKSDLAAAEAAGLQKAKDAQQAELFRWFGIAGAGMTLVGGVAAAVGAWAGFGPKPGLVLLCIGLAVGSFIFVWGTPVFWVLVSLAGLGLIVAGWMFLQDALKHRKLSNDLELHKATLTQVVKVVEEQKLPKTDPLKVALNGSMDRVEKDLIDTIKDKLP
jgi:hypothetical protein